MPLFVYFHPFTNTMTNIVKIEMEKAWSVSLGFEPTTTVPMMGQTNQLVVDLFIKLCFASISCSYK